MHPAAVAAGRSTPLPLSEVTATIGRVGFPRWQRIVIRPADELWAIGERAVSAYRAGRLPMLAITAGLLSVAGYVMYSTRPLRHLAIAAGAVSADQPLHLEFVRVPGSAFLPTPNLPLPLAVMQILVVLGIAELVTGARATATVAVAGHVASTLLARLLFMSATPGVIALPLGQARILDTGPSAMTTAVGTWLLLRYRAYASVGMLAAGLTIAAVLQDNVDGREHLAAFAIGALATVLPGQIRRLADVVAGVQSHLGRALRVSVPAESSARRPANRTLHKPAHPLHPEGPSSAFNVVQMCRADPRRRP